MDAKRVKETEVDFLKKEYASFVADDVHGNPKTLHEFEEYDCFLDTSPIPEVVRSCQVPFCVFSWTG